MPGAGRAQKKVDREERTPSAREAAREAAREVAREGELYDVPAAVVCATCGEPDCAGCSEERSRSGVIAIIAWEREGSMLGRVWSTAHAATINSEAFFENLPDGPVAPALRFAAISELLAASTLSLVMLAMFSAIAPLWLRDVMLDPVARDTAMRVAILAVPGLAMMLVAAHAAHGFALDVGARRSGAQSQPSRALRFGLYAAGWDVMLGPIGFFVLLVKQGVGAAFRLGSIGVGLPTRSSLAFLRGAYNLQHEAAKPALNTSYVAAILATLVCAFVITSAVVVAIIL
jgi:hypothetical protein